MTAPTKDRAPIVPPLIQSWENFERAIDHQVDRSRYWLKFHGIRSPKYAAKAVGRVPAGLWRLVCIVCGWVVDPEGREAWLETRTSVKRSKGSASEIRRMLVVHLKMIAARFLAVVAALLVLAGVVAAADPTDPVTVGGAGFVSVVGLAKLGKRKRPIMDQPTSDKLAPKLTHTLITQALRQLGINDLTRAIDERAETEEETGRPPIDFVTDVMLTSNGHRVEFDVPGGVTAASIRSKRHRLASALRRPASCVWPEVNLDPSTGGHEGRVVLTILDRPLGDLDRVDWPGTNGPVDVFEPQPIGKSATGEVVNLSLMFMTGLIGAIPRRGKSFALRLIALILAADDRVRIMAFDFKATGDLGPFRSIAHAYRIGTSTADIAYAMAHLRKLHESMGERAKAMAAMDSSEVPESKLTPELASDYSRDFRPWAVIFDEVHLLYSDPVHGPEAAHLVHDLVTLGPALGIMVWQTTQKPSSESVPLLIRDNVGVRICFQVKTQQANDMVLGQGMHAAGVRATELTKDDQGVGILVGDDDPVQVKFFYVDVPGAERAIADCFERRMHQGLLTGYAAGNDVEAGGIVDRESNIVDDVRAVWPEGEQWVAARVIAASLQDAWPDEYPGINAARLTPKLKPFGITSEDHKYEGRTAKCYSLEQVESAQDEASGDLPE